MTSDDADLRGAGLLVGGLLEDLGEVRTRSTVQETVLRDQHIGRTRPERRHRADQRFGDTVLEACEQLAVVYAVHGVAVELASRQEVDLRAVRQLELRQRLEQQIQIGTVHFRDVHVVVDVLLGILVDELAPILVIRVIHAEHTEADVRHLLGSAVECQLRILRFNLGLDFLAGTADAFLADFTDCRVACFSSLCFFVAWFGKLYKDKNVLYPNRSYFDEEQNGQLCPTRKRNR